MRRADKGTRVSLGSIAREWTRIGCIGFGGPPAHIALLRELCVSEHDWLGDDDFEHAIAATNLLPGPGSTQLAIYCAWRLRGIPGAVVGGLGFIVPGLVLIIALSAAFLATAPPRWLRGVGAGASAVVPAVAIWAALGLIPASRARLKDAAARWRWVAYGALGAVATILIGPLLVLVLIGCGLFELVWRRGLAGDAARADGVLIPILASAVAMGGVGALCWTALKVGALSYGGGFVIIPLMQGDAVEHYHWMTDAQFLNAVALGQATPGPVVHTVAVVGYAAGGVGGALLAASVAFVPSFTFIFIGGRRFERLRNNPRAKAFLDGAGPAAIGAIVGSAVVLAGGLSQWWQWLVLAAAAVALLVNRLGILWTILAAAAVGAGLALAGAGVPG